LGFPEWQDQVLAGVGQASVLASVPASAGGHDSTGVHQEQRRKKA
jgi:hypothetical protein